MNAAYSKTRREYYITWDCWEMRIQPCVNVLTEFPLKSGRNMLMKDGGLGIWWRICLCINVVLKGTRNLPIIALVKSTYFRLAALFVKKGSEAEAQFVSGQVFSQTLLQPIEVNGQQIGIMVISTVSRANESFVVEELAWIRNWSQGSYRDHWCDCGYFQALCYPCRHVLAACAYARLDWGSFVDDVYHMQTIFNVYKLEFSAIAKEDY